MEKQASYPDWYQQVNWLPSIDWNVKFFGGHEQRVNKNWTAPKEAHVGFEIILVLEGCQETQIGNNVYIQHTGDIILIPPGFEHVNRCVSEDGLHYFCAHFNVDDPSFRQQMLQHERMVFPAHTEENLHIRTILDQWITLAQHQGPYTTSDRFRVQALLFQLFGLFAQIICSSEEVRESIPPQSAQFARAIAEAIKAKFNPHLPDIEHSFDHPFRIEDITASLGISSGYGLEVFRKVYGISPRKYLSELKLHEAKLLIQQPDLTLNQIAHRLGYSHLSHFSRQFKRWTGMSPLKYRSTVKRITE